MGKAKRKPRPSMPDWFWWGQDGCWFCKQRNNCNQCKANREYVKEFGEGVDRMCRELSAQSEGRGRNCN